MFLPGESQGWGRTESDTIEATAAAAVWFYIAHTCLNLSCIYLWAFPHGLYFKGAILLLMYKQDTYPLEKEMATLSSILAWRIPWTEEPGGLQSTGSQSRTRLSDFTFFSSTAVLLPFALTWELFQDSTT